MLLFFLLVFIALPLYTVLSGQAPLGRDFRTADRSSAGIAPRAENTPEAVVQVYHARALNWRGIFGVHTWIATKPENAPEYLVHQVIGWRLYRGLSAVVSVPGIPDGRWFGNEPTLIAECESALALFMQREGDVRAAVAHARSVLANADATLEARYRASLALASLHQDAHDHETAYRLYRETHDVVKDLDDEIAMASWLQRAALAKAAHARQSAGRGELDKPGVKQAIADLQQCIEYAAKVPDGPTTTLDHLLLAEMYVLQKRYKQALALYDLHLPQCEGDGFLHEATAAMADRANCLLQLGETDAGYAQAVSALRRLTNLRRPTFAPSCTRTWQLRSKPCSNRRKRASIGRWRKPRGIRMITNKAKRGGCCTKTQ